MKRNTRNKTGVTGVSIQTKIQNDKEYSTFNACAMVNGRLHTRSFSFNKYGEDEAFRLACEWRKERIKELNEQGAGYTARHGLENKEDYVNQ